MITISFEKAVANAKNAEACEGDLETIKSLGSIEAVLKHEKAAYWLYWYAKDVIKGRWEAVEKYIMNDPFRAYYYAKDVIKGRWEAAEKYIMKDPQLAHWYAKDVIKGRWEAAEKYIMKNPLWAYFYAKDVIKGRWEAAEKYIMKDQIIWENYQDYFKITS